MNVEIDDPRRTRLKPPAKVVGLLIGLAAATPGLASPIASIPVRPWHIFVLVAFVISLQYQFKSRPAYLLRFLKLDVALLLFTLATLVAEVLNAQDLNYAADYMTVVRPIFWLAIYWSARFVLHTLEDARGFLVWFTAPVFPSVLIGFGQVLGLSFVQQLILTISPDSGGFAARIEDGRLIRATALVQNWTQYGAYLCTVIASAMALLILSRRHRIGNQIYPWLTLLVAGLGTVTTLTLSSIVTALAIFVVSSREARATGQTLIALVLVGVLGAASFGALIGERIEQQFANKREASSEGETSLIPSTLLYRHHIWATETIPMIQDRPFTGWGSNVYDKAWGNADPKRTYPYQMVWISPESQWLNLLMTYGFIGFIGFLFIVYQILAVFLSARRAGAGWILKPTLVLFGLMLLSAYVASVFTNHGLIVGLWALLAVLTAFKNPRRQQAAG